MGGGGAVAIIVGVNVVFFLHCICVLFFEIHQNIKAFTLYESLFSYYDNLTDVLPSQILPESKKLQEGCQCVALKHCFSHPKLFKPCSFVHFPLLCASGSPPLAKGKKVMCDACQCLLKTNGLNAAVCAQGKTLCVCVCVEICVCPCDLSWYPLLSHTAVQ